MDGCPPEKDTNNRKGDERDSDRKEPDRKMASPTESAVIGEEVKGTLRSRYVEHGNVFFDLRSQVSISAGMRYVQEWR